MRIPDRYDTGMARTETEIQALTDAYLRTTYRVLTAEESVDIRIGAVNPALERLLHSHGAGTWAFVTASNPRSRQTAEEDNAQRNDALKRSLSKAGWQYLEAVGIPDRRDWRAEHSVLILGIGRDEAMSLGRRWGQNAIVFGVAGTPPELVWIV